MHGLADVYSQTGKGRGRAHRDIAEVLAPHFLRLYYLVSIPSSLYRVICRREKYAPLHNYADTALLGIAW